MNIDEYRALKAQVETPAVESQVEKPIVEEVVPVVEAVEVVEQIAPTENTVEQTTTPDTIEIDGVAVPIDELKGGYLRQSDYTRKTQELARDKERIRIAEAYYNALQADPESAKEFASEHKLPYVDPEQLKVQELQTRYEDLLLEREIDNMKLKYADFDQAEVIQLAVDKKINNLEDAYLLHKSKSLVGGGGSQQLDVEALKEQIRQELKQELQSNVDTSSIIGTGRSARPVSGDTPQLSPAEIKVATSMKMTPAEYSKWKNV